MATTRNDDDIDYTAEGRTPPREKEDPTNAGYDEAAHSGPNRYGVPEGEGGVFGTSGGGTYDGGMHVEERPVITTERASDEPVSGDRDRGKSKGKT
ncbi:MAG TPA: hypothetical protein VHL59_18825 [Thermoanaerobaculia bacterium]|nr:hypothetical protein [Thermoanaerobaculia bacterium]